MYQIHYVNSRQAHAHRLSSTKMPTTTKRWLVLPLPLQLLLLLSVPPPPPAVGAKQFLCLLWGRFVSYSVPHQVRMHEAS
jgi:hypothetical protein